MLRVSCALSRGLGTSSRGGCSSATATTVFSRRDLNTLSHAAQGETVTIEDTSSSSSGRPLLLKTGHIARFAEAAVVAQRAQSAVLATCVAKTNDSPVGFLPLSVDFRQSAAAIGRIPTNYLRRELGQTDADILTSRVIDRSIRPLIHPSVTDSIQINCKPLSMDDDADEVALAVNAAATALLLSRIPIDGAAAAVRVAEIGGKLVLNPPRRELRGVALNLLLTGCKEKRTLMIEMDGKQITVERFEEAVDEALTSIDAILAGMEQLRQVAGKPKMEIITDEKGTNFDRLVAEVRTLCETSIQFIFTDSRHDKISRDTAVAETLAEVFKVLSEDYPERIIREAHSLVMKNTLRELILHSELRCDGRGLRDFRPLSMQVDCYEHLHGSALFQRGQTQVFTTCTFDSPSAAFHPDSVSQLLGAQRKKSFMLHYEFPSYATNDLSTGRGVANRRELGHGALAEKALAHIVPSDFPFTIRLACQVLESNGSSSMASVCGGTLALLDAGVPLEAAAAGVAIGMVSDEQRPDERYKVLTDLIGIEDYAGDMDFKIAGTRKGFTAMQLDVKKRLGLTRQQLRESVQQGDDSLRVLLDRMDGVQATPRKEFKDSVPVMEAMKVESYRRHALFRGGGYNLKQIEAETGVKISAEDDVNLVMTAPNREMMLKAREMVDELVSSSDDANLSFGQSVTAEVVAVLDGGVSIKLKSTGRAHFVKNAQLHSTPIQHPSAIGIKIGDRLTLQYLGRDTATGAIRLVRKTYVKDLPGSNQLGKR